MRKKVRKLQTSKTSPGKGTGGPGQTEKEQSLKLELFRTLHEYGPLKDICERVLSLIKEYLNCRALAIRLKEGEDYPYLVSKGFPRKFVKSENYLYLHDKKGNCRRDSSGRPLLVCMCGMIISGRPIPKKPFFTKNGSFWTNSTTELLATTKLRDRGTVTRNACNQYGYESVALIPVKLTTGNIGLLQINDKKRNLFTPENIAFLEALGYMVGTVIERKTSEEELKASEQRFENIFDSVLDGILLADEETKTFLTANRALCRMLGYSLEEIQNLGVSDIHLPKDLPYVVEQFEKQAKKEIGLARNITVKRKDGSLFYADINSSPVILSGRKYLVGIFRDVTERKRVEDALRAREEELTVILEGAHDVIFQISRSGIIQYVSPVVKELFGHEPGDLIGKHFKQTTPLGEMRKAWGAIKRVLAGETVRNFELDQVDTKGKVIPTEINAAPVRKAGKITAVQGVMRNISQRKKVEAVLKRDKETFEKLVKERTGELLEAQEELGKTKRLSDIGALAATMAHELRNPLGVIRTAAYNVARKRENPDIDKHLANIEKKVLESDQIINNLLSYSRIKMPHYRKIKIHTILRESIISARSRFGDQKVSLSIRLEPIKGDFIEADPFQAGEIFDNILNNAYQALPSRKGKIEISGGPEGKDFLEINFLDNGRGMDKEERKRAFEPFFTRKSKGTGLGLTICRELVSLHGGKIELESTKGKGTTVRVSLPRKRKKE